MRPEPPATAPAKGGLVAYLSLDGALKAADFYVRALGAEIAAAMPSDDRGRTMHVHLYVNGTSLMLADAFPEYGHALEPPRAFTLTLIVEDIDAWWRRAIEAGATPVKEPGEMFWGDRYAQVRDPFGVLWALNQPKG
jgi:uncharacterized glyoxalase superfamily protein PhnB